MTFTASVKAASAAKPSGEILCDSNIHIDKPSASASRPLRSQ